MFKNLIFVNYSIGMGGEFFIIELHKAISNTNPKLMFNELLRMGAVINNITNKTNITSTKGVILISASGA